ncbi:MAG: hypothetical protein A3G81_05275 [Betaproteobacteria bacterium RIFCSPLOWO2_12_FULL_65_14]|nr:MAG: hypothetical protein A3G81_05275 [Betaproteobacteria bacterium RIFCSPLOWO2_12_FULL_65_14]
MAKAPTHAGLAELIENASWFAEEMTQKFRDPKSPPVACKEGCYWCCYQNVGITAPEAFRIVRFVMSDIAADLRAGVLERLHRLDQKVRGSSQLSRAKMHVPCAFLHEGRCTVYAVRPLACAEATSYDADSCKRAQRIGFPFGAVIHEKARLIAYLAVQRGLLDGLRDALPAADCAPLELTSAVVQVLKTSDAEELWLNGGNVFSGAQLIREPEKGC